MQDYSYIYVSGMVLTNTEITLHSRNTKQRKNASGQFLRAGYSYYKQNTTLILGKSVEVYLTGDVDFTWMVSDCEELVGVTHRR